MKHLKIEKVRTLNNLSFENPNYKQSDLYDGSIYILTSKRTFSSVHGFAGIIKNNNLGLVVGEPTGNATISYANMKNHELPNSKINIKVSTATFILPNTLTHADTLEPDLYICPTRNDIIQNRDPVMDWIINYNKKCTTSLLCGAH